MALLVGAADAAATHVAARAWYVSLAAPPGSPPPWLFAPVGTALYVAMGVAAWLAWRRPGHRPALLLWGWQLLVNAAWNPSFFGLHKLALACAIASALVMLVAATTRAFARISPAAGLLLLPYLLWTCYAAYLCAGFWWLNPA